MANETPLETTIDSDISDNIKRFLHLDKLSDIDITDEILKLITKKTEMILTQNDRLQKFLDSIISGKDDINLYLSKRIEKSKLDNLMNQAKSLSEKKIILLNILIRNSINYNGNESEELPYEKFITRNSIKLIHRFQRQYNLKSDAILGSNTVNILLDNCKNIKKMYDNKDIIISIPGNIAIPKIEKITTHECAQYVTESIMRLHKNFSNKDVYTTLTGVIGNARTMFENITNRGGSNLGCIFKEDKKKTNSVQDVKQHVTTLFNKHKNEIQSIKWKTGDIVGLYYPQSSNHLKANNECNKTCNTHVGYIRGFTTDGIPIVSHNIHGTVWNQPITELLSTDDSSNGCVTRGARPNLLASIAQQESYDAKSADDLIKPLENSRIKNTSTNIS